MRLVVMGLASLFLGCGSVPESTDPSDTPDSGGGKKDGAIADARPLFDARVIQDGGFQCDDPCACPLPCPDPREGTTSICGRVYDVAGTNPLGGVDGVEAKSVVVAGVDAIRASQGNEVQPLWMVNTDSCGRFIARDVQGGYLVLGTDDAPSTTDNRATTFIIRNFEVNRAWPDVRAYTTKWETDRLWNEQAGFAFGDAGFSGFASVGTALFIFLGGSPETPPYPRHPEPGVRVMVGSAAPAAVYYFRDTFPLHREQPTRQMEATGDNGSALVPQVDTLLDVTGKGGGCQWPTNPLRTRPGSILVVEMPGDGC